MRFIKPDEISGKILSLLEESKERVLIVSPYVKISKWYKLIKKLNSLQDRGIKLEFIIRDDETNRNSFEELERLNVRFRAIPNLHCKLYINERTAIFTSMNLLLSSEINSLELGYETETEEEYLELHNFCQNHLNVEFSIQTHSNSDQLADRLINELSSKTNKRVRIKKENGSFRINTITNNYDCFIWNRGNENRLRVSGILSGQEFENLSNNGGIIVPNLLIEYQPGNGKHYDMAWGTGMANLKSQNLDAVADSELNILLTNIIDFVKAIDEFKRTPHNKDFHE
ncbi:MAG: phospholipase D-like domain-containing protein [Reichenbachiella sp.]|uniref:phospholipase D-like domain-containing protein n=1 Tax=Reichenbachiella sp. TaxID=2184521 RepID=UPI00329984E8